MERRCAWLAVVFVLIGLVLLHRASARPAPLFASSFEVADASGCADWGDANHCRDDGTAENGSHPVIAASGCQHLSRCAELTVEGPSARGGQYQQSVFFSRTFSHSGPTLYISGWWRFPRGYSWDVPPPPPEPHPGASADHKLIIVNVADGTPGDRGRTYLNLRGEGRTPTLALWINSVNLSDWITQGVRWPDDGLWHHLELELTRVSYGSGGAQVWLDGETALRFTGDVCGGSCATVTSVNVGAYVNQGAVRTQTFWIDNFLIDALGRKDSLVYRADR